MTLRTLFLTLMLFTCAILMVLGLSVSSTIQSIESTDRADTATQWAGPTGQAAQATLFFRATGLMGTATELANATQLACQRSYQATLFAMATEIIETQTQVAAPGYITPTYSTASAAQATQASIVIDQFREMCRPTRDPRYTPPTQPPTNALTADAQKTLFMRATQIIRQATQTVQAEQTAIEDAFRTATAESRP